MPTARLLKLVVVKKRDEVEVRCNSITGDRSLSVSVSFIKAFVVDRNPGICINFAKRSKICHHLPPVPPDILVTFCHCIQKEFWTPDSSHLHNLL